MNNIQIRGYIGTYTKHTSEGIYSFILNLEAGEIKDLTCAAKIGNPTYLVISQNKKYLYSVVKEADKGGVAAYAIAEDGQLQQLNQTVSAGAPPCHISVNQDQTQLLSANYHQGTINLYPIAENGNIQDVKSFAQHEGSGPDPRQEKAHTHYAGVTPDEKFIIAVELGCDAIITYEKNDDALVEKTRFQCKPGSGPRHLVFHPSQNIAYVMTEFSSEIIVLKYHPENGSFSHLQTHSTLPDYYMENNQGSAIHITKDGRFVYAANRGHNSIAVFEVDQNSYQLSFVEHIGTEGDWPRDFSLDPSDRFLLAANQNSNNLALYSRNPDNGKLTLIKSGIEVPEPVCVKFLDK